jgi:hypothetical protein
MPEAAHPDAAPGDHSVRIILANTPKNDSLSADQHDRALVDIFMASVLIAPVQFGSVVTIAPGPGGVAFAGAVILTILAAESFDPRLMWDAAFGTPSAETRSTQGL